MIGINRKSKTKHGVYIFHEQFIFPDLLWSLGGLSVGEDFGISVFLSPDRIYPLVMSPSQVSRPANISPLSAVTQHIRDLIIPQC